MASVDKPPCNVRCEEFGLDSSTDSKIRSLFDTLKRLEPMDKNGPMNGRCTRQTDQMENFLLHVFGFKNISDKYIVPGVKSFSLYQPISEIPTDKEVHFPSLDSTNPFIMTIEEIIKWQKSYRVYADSSVEGIDKEFLTKALQGESKDGEEAFRMKFVVRISTCPILMEFDAKVIPRRLDEKWPHKIKLVSATGIDFAGRKHDFKDITHYVSNWREIYEVDQEKGKLKLFNSRDLCRKKGHPLGNLDEKLLLNDLIAMAKLRLYACDKEGVQIVIETGVGLGIFVGKHIGIDEKVRKLSAVAIRKVLKHDRSLFTNIQAVVFALPLFSRDEQVDLSNCTYNDFVNEFQRKKDKLRIPVLVIDQDMHRLAVAIAKEGFIVSELNPADSHGVFGEYWQNRGPAVEEKLALTTVGLLVQHHLFNPHVLKVDNYHFTKISTQKST